MGSLFVVIAIDEFYRLQQSSRSHQLGRTRDWVVVYFYDGDHRERQHTVVTETRGPLSDQRVVRGREVECREHYASTDSTQLAS